MRYGIQFHCRPWASNGTHLFKYVPLEAPLQAGDYCLMADYQGRVKYRVYDEASDSFVLVLEDKHWYHAEYIQKLDNYLNSGWQKLNQHPADPLLVTYPLVPEKPFELGVYLNPKPLTERRRISRYFGIFMTTVFALLNTIPR